MRTKQRQFSPVVIDCSSLSAMNVLKISLQCPSDYTDIISEIAAAAAGEVKVHWPGSVQVKVPHSQNAEKFFQD